MQPALCLLTTYRRAECQDVSCMLMIVKKPTLSLLPSATQIGQTVGLISEAWILSAAISMHAHRCTLSAQVRAFIPKTHKSTSGLPSS